MPTYTPKISIIVPVYNVERYLRQCLDSVLAQDFDQWEAVVIDDGSTDGSGQICDEYAGRDNRFKVIHQSNSGLAGARNAGFMACAGEYIYCLDSDDWLSPSCCSNLYKAAAGNGCEVAVGRMRVEGKGLSHIEKARFPTRTFSSAEFASLMCKDREFHNFMWNKLFHRSLLTITPPEIKYFEDVAFSIAWILKARKIIYVSESIGYHYRLRKTSILGAKSRIKALAFYEAVEIRLRNFLETVENVTPRMAANCVYGSERVMCNLARRKLVATKEEMPDKEIAALIARLATMYSGLWQIAKLAKDNMPLKQRMGFRLASWSPTAYIAWSRVGTMFHRHRPSANSDTAFD